MNKVYYIYRHIRNDNNQVFYIGLSGEKSKSVERCKDFRQRSRNKIWYEIFLECNKSITVEILFEYDNYTEAAAKEIELIKFYKELSAKDNLKFANIGLGGKSSATPSKSIIQYDLHGNFIKEWPNMYEAADFYKVTFKAISRVIVKKQQSAGFQWRWKILGVDFKKPISPYLILKNIHQLSLDGNFIRTFNSMGEASKELKIDRASINNCALNKRPTAGGFKWSFKKPID